MHDDQIHLTENVYHRIYRLFKKNIDTPRIASALNLPFSTVNTIVRRFASGDNTPARPRKTRTLSPHHRRHATDAELEIFIFPQTRYLIIDVNGSMTAKHINELREAFAETGQSKWKAIAVRMSGVEILDKPVIDYLQEMHAEYKKKNCFLAILDPSNDIETIIAEYDVDKKVPVFGTETAFEETAFRISSMTI